MTTFDRLSQPEAGKAHEGLTFRQRLRYRLGRRWIRFTPLWPAVRALGEWLESECFPAARKAGRESVMLELTGKAGLRVMGMDVQPPPADMKPVFKLLKKVCIEQLDLDARLESNQIADVFTLLRANTSALLRRSESNGGRGGLSDLWGEDGLQFACTRTTVIATRLVVRYSYCLTCFSRVVQWFERRYRHFGDHRALFHAGPRYAALAALVGIAIAAASTFYHSPWVVLAVSAAGAVVLFTMVYLFFMVVGSLEYDNEEKARRLSDAYDKLKRYADRVQEDLARARFVQERILPPADAMPLPDRVDWASCYCPAVEVSGDYFDAIALDDDRVAIVFADVSGHGMAAAFITAILKTTFQAWADDGQDLGQFVVSANRTLCRLTPEESFATLFVGIYDARSRELTYVNCGHYPEPWLVPASPDRPVAQMQQGRAMLLGVIEETDHSPARVALDAGDRVVLVTDGIIETRNDFGRMYTAEKLEQFLTDHRGRHVKPLVDAIIKDVSDFGRNTQQQDDRTILAFGIR